VGQMASTWSSGGCHTIGEALRQEWLDGVCVRISQEQRIRHLAIWPIGLFEAARLGWALSADAALNLPWLLERPSRLRRE
jgi:hypothetical protein